MTVAGAYAAAPQKNDAGEHWKTEKAIAFLTRLHKDLGANAIPRTRAQAAYAR